MTIEPETKSWTWVLERPCEECGFDTADRSRVKTIAPRCRDAAAPWPGFVADPRARLRPSRRTVGRRSNTPATCATCSATVSYRLGRMLNEDNPLFDNWDQDETAVTERYDEQDPARVADELGVAATELADLYDTVDGDLWSRPGTAQRRRVVHHRIVRSVLPARPDAPHRRRATRFRAVGSNDERRRLTPVSTLSATNRSLHGQSGPFWTANCCAVDME